MNAGCARAGLLLVLPKPSGCVRFYSIMSRSTIYQRKQLLDKKASQTTKKPDPPKEEKNTKSTPKPTPSQNGSEPYKGFLNKSGPLLGTNDAATIFHQKPIKQPPNPRSLSIALVGAPNAGKSTLVNWIVNDQVSAISPKAQTTRDRMLGILTKGNTQLLFYDTPGIVPSSDRAKTVQEIVTAAWEALEDADIVVFIVDAAKVLDENVTHIVQQLETNLAGVRKHLKLPKADSGDEKPSETTPSEAEAKEATTEKADSTKSATAENKFEGSGAGLKKAKKERDLKMHKPIGKKCILILNKVDLVYPQERLLYKTQKLNESGLFTETFFTSAISGDRVDEVTDFLLSQAVDRPWIYEPELVSRRLRELTLIVIADDGSYANAARTRSYQGEDFERLNQELPYVVKQQNIGWTVLPDGGLRIDQRLIVPKLSQRVIILGKAGALLKQLTTAAAKDLEQIFQRKVYLNLMVQEKKNYHEYDYT